MRILHLIHRLSGGGAERQLTLLSPEMAKAGHEVHIAYLREGPGHVSIPRVMLHQIGSLGNYDPTIPLKLFRLIRTTKPDVVQSWIMMMDIMAGVLSSVAEFKWVLREPVSELGYQPSTAKIRIRKKLALISSMVVANSSAGARYWLSHGYQVPRVTIIRNAVALKWANKPHSIQVEDPAVITLTCAGRLVPQKNLDTLVMAIEKVKQRYKVRLLIAGEGSTKKHLLDLTRSLNLKDEVTFLGYLQTDVLCKTISNSALFASLSKFEGMPNTVCEAAVCRTPLLLSDIPEHRELFDEQSAFYVPTDSVTRICETICYAFEHKQEATQKAAKAFEVVQQRTPDLIASEYLNLYEKLLIGAGVD